MILVENTNNMEYCVATDISMDAHSYLPQHQNHQVALMFWLMSYLSYLTYLSKRLNLLASTLLQILQFAVLC